MEINIRDLVNELQQKIITFKTAGITDDFDLEMKILEIMPEFYDKYPSLVKRLCKSENLDNTYLYKMIELIEQINKGEKSLNLVEYNLGQELADKFVNPIVDKLTEK